MTAPTTDLYRQIHDEYLAKASDPAWKLAMEIFIGELLQQNATYHQAQIQAICDWAAERQLNRHKTAITKRYLTERLVELRKDRHPMGGMPSAHKRAEPTGRPSSYDEFKETLWRRSPNGRFASFVGPKHVQENYEAKARRDKQGNVQDLRDRGVHESDTFADPRSVISRAIAQRPENERNHQSSNYGLIVKPEELPAGVSQSQHSVDVAHAFDRMTWSLAQKTGDSKDKQRVQFVISSPDGYHRVVTPEAGKMPDVKFALGERVSFMTPVGPDHPVTIAGQAVNIGHISGMSDEQAAKAGAVAADVHGALTKTSWGDKMTHTSNALRVMSNDSPLATQAHAVASLFNILGPDASRAFGNKLKQLSYRYLGQEVPADRFSETAKAGRGVKGNGEMQSTRDYERQLARDLVPAIPSSTEYNLALQAGSSPPSRGYILNSDGRVVSESVGYADDWYTPFNLRKLPQMRGGSYVRTRGYGGLTPEDIRLAMRTGAQRATVISNNGVFTMEFEPKALHWGHRFGFAGNGMIKRYARALDAIKHNSVTQADGTGGKLGLDAQGYVVAMRDLQMKNPNYIVAPNDQVPSHQSLREFGNIARAEVVGEAAKDKGYMSPLSIHADDAVATWHDPRVREMWSTDDKKYKWSDVEQGRIHHDAGLGIIDKLSGGGVSGRPMASSGALGTPATRTTGDTSKTNAWGQTTGTVRVDSNGYLRNFENQFCTPAGKVITPNEARNQYHELKKTNPEYTRTGKIYNASDEWHSSRPSVSGSSGPVTESGNPATTWEAERRERSGHWNDDEALSAASDVRSTLLRLKEMGHLKDTRHWKALDLAQRATVAPGPGYTGTTEYADFVEKLTKSPTYRVQLAADLDDAIDGRHLSSDTTHHEPGELLATLKGVKYDPEAVSGKSTAREDERGDNYASLDLDGHRPILPSEMEGSDFVKAHVRNLERTARNGQTPEVREQGKTAWSEHQEYMKMIREIETKRKVAVARNQAPPSTEDIFAGQPGDRRELFDRLNRQYTGMIQHGTKVESENPAGTGGFDAERSTLRGETVPTVGELKEGTGTVTSEVPHVADLLADRVDPQSAADAVYDDIYDQAETKAGRIRGLNHVIGKYEAVANANQHRNREGAGRIFQVITHLEDYRDNQRDER